MLTSVAVKSVEMSLKDAKLFRQQCYVGGAWINAENGGAFAVTNPADGSQIGTVPSFSAADTQRAIDAAAAAFPTWRDGSKCAANLLTKSMAVDTSPSWARRFWWPISVARKRKGSRKKSKPLPHSTRDIRHRC